MKFIKKIDIFTNEAKIKDVLLKKQADKVSSVWGEKYLFYEEIEPTKNINQGKWKLTEEDKNKVLGEFFGNIDMDNIFKLFNSISDHLSKLILESIDIDLIKEKNQMVVEKVKQVFLKDFNPKKPYADQILLMNRESFFRKLLVNETKKDEVIERDENGRPILDEDGQMIKIKKEKGDPIFDKNLTTFLGFIESYNRSYNTSYNFDTHEVRSIVDILSNRLNDDYVIDFNIFNKDIYLMIRHKAHDILNMSISKFYSSCQHLYSGSYKEQLLANVFDPNSIPAFLIFDTPIYIGDDKISDFLPLSRMIIRNIHKFDDSDDRSILFDRTYPDRIRNTFYEIVEKYSDNKKNIGYNDYSGDKIYIFSPDIDIDDALEYPYMDKMAIQKVGFIGKNTKKLYLNRNYDWNNTIISPSATIEELVIESEKIPKNIFEVLSNVKWVKFRYLTIKSLIPFNKIISNNLYLDKCKITDESIKELNNLNLNKLNIRSCDINLSLIKDLEINELHIIYTASSIEEINEVIINNTINKLYVSGDIITSKKMLSELKSKYSNTIISISGLSLI